MKKLIPITLILFLVLLVNNAFSQVQPDSANLVRIETIDGNEYIGLLQAEDSLQVEINTKLLGKIVIPRATIKLMSHIEPTSIKSGKLWGENSQSSRYFWSPNGYGLKKGEGYYQNIWVFWNQASVGVTDYFSIGAGIVPLFLFAGTSTPVWITPKFSIPVVKDKLNLGAGAIVGTVIGESSSGFGILYGLGTVGNRNNNLTLGLGYGFAGGQGTSSPIVTLSGMLRVGPRGYLLTENYYFSTADGSVFLLMFGGRTVTRKIGFDYGLVIPAGADMDTFVAVPWLGFTVPLGKKY